MGNLVNFNNYTNKNDEYIDLDLYLSYKNQLKEYINILGKEVLKNKCDKNTQFLLLQNFYTSFFNVSEKIAYEMCDGNFKNSKAFAYFIKEIDELSQKLLPIDRISKLLEMDDDSIDSLRKKNVEYKEEYSIDDYIKYRDILDEYINELTEYSKLSRASDFVINEQLYIVTNLYVAFENIGEFIRKEIEEKDNTNAQTLSYMINEYKNILESIPNFVPSNTIKKLGYKPVSKK